MTPQEQLEDDIKTLEKAEAIWDRAKIASGETGLRGTINTKKRELEALKKPKFRDGTLVRIPGCEEIYTWGHAKNRALTARFEPLPIETILRHLAPEGKVVRWEYISSNSIVYKYEAGGIVEDDNMRPYRIPAPYREDWEGIEGTL